ncbi:MAG: VWA domain-containing protein [Candidatus Rokubacteria bacterium]|nr:VWA domain-containing protein [Candidatus Rokubacteria bacterium]
MDAQRLGSARYYLYRVLRQLDLSNLLRRAIRDEREQADRETAFEERLLREEQGRRIEEFRRLIAEEIWHRLVGIMGPRDVADAYRPKLIEDLDFLAASPAELRQMRYAIRPLAHKLAARISHRRRFRRHGRLDVRRTMRRSLSAGGVPLEPAFRYPRISKPDLYLLCDMSGSVAEFAGFTMSLLYAMTEEFSKIRSFVFVDGIDEVSEVLADSSTVLDAPHLLARANAVSLDGHSDYGNVLRRFWGIYGSAALGPKATVIITGDARNNYRDSGVEALRAVKERARRVYWLNPEPRWKWDTTDSIVDTYAPFCAGVFEVRNLRQLANFVQGIM